jgi:YD repeat-containing protein
LGGARDHNLLSARDGLNVQWFQAVYTPTAVTTDFLYDRVSSEIIGTASETLVFTYLPKTPDPNNRFNTTKTIVNDAVGNVHESLFDAKNRLIDLRQFTGRSTPGVAVTESTNRPTGQLRPTDPAFFKTTIDWNRDSLPTRITWPRGNGLEMVYHRDFDPAANPRERANLRVRRQLPVSGAALVERFEHQPGFGTREQRFRPGKWTMTDYNFETPMTSIALATDASGLSATGMCVSNISLRAVGPAAERARRRFSDALISEIQIPTLDGTSKDAAYMTVKLQPEMPIAFGPQPEDTDKNGFDEYLCLSHTDARGFTWTCARDANGNAMSVTRPDGVTTDLEHNANGQLTAIVLPPNASAHRERDEFHYYTTGAQNGYLQSIICDAGGLNLTTGFTPNPVGEVIQVVDPRGKDTQFFVNQLNQVVQMTSRDAGSGIRYLTNIFRDANNRVTSIDVQNKDEFGIVGANAFFTTGFGYDVLDHVTSMTREVDSAHTVTTQYFYNAIRDLIEVRSPLAASAVQPDARVQFAYDERNLPFICTAAPGSANATRSTYSYDANGRLNQIDRGAPVGPQHTTTFTYDGFDRVIQRTSPVGTQVQFSYNPSHQPTQQTVVGTFLDNLGNPATGTLASRSWTYGSTGVCTRVVASFFDIISQAPILDGSRTTIYGYDPALNPISRTDDNNHTAQYSYDGANRISRVTDPKGNRVDYTYDNNGNIVTRSRTDKSDTAQPDQVFAMTFVYDGLDRLITATENVGNARSYMYDSRSNCVRLVDPRNNLTQYEYDGLNRLLRSGRDMNANGSSFNPGIDIISGRTWDDNSRLISASDPNSHATQYTYDALGRITRRDNADATFKTWTRDAWGNAIQSNDENATVCINNYDNLNRLKQRQINPGPGVSNATTFEIYDYPGDYLIRERATNDATTVR